MDTPQCKAKQATKVNRLKRKHFFVAIFLMTLFLASTSYAITPIAHTDVVPYQRVKAIEPFKFGVVAFSKPGIDRVEFAISGAGYTGSTKTVTTMAYNTRVASAKYDGVWEYYIELSTSEFTQNGAFTVTPTAYDNDGNFRVLPAVPMIVEGASPYVHTEAWVDIDGSDGTGTVGNSSDPFPSIQSAITAAQAENGGSSAGNIIYLEEGVYSIANLVADTSAGEFLTFAKSASADIANVVVNEGAIGGKINIQHAKFDHLTLLSTGSKQEILNQGYIIPTNYVYWTNSCRFIGSGTTVEWSNPVSFVHRLAKVSEPNEYYSTDDYTENVQNAYGASYNIVRGADIKNVGNDVFHMYSAVINVTVETDDNTGTGGLHADILQQYQQALKNKAVNNTLAYNVRVIDAHCQGIMRSAQTQSSQDNAYINVSIEMREPGNLNESGRETIQSMLNSSYPGLEDDHLLVWFCSFPYAPVTLTAGATNSSFVGNVFWQERSSAVTIIPASTEWAYNHFSIVYGLTTDDCTPTSVDISQGKDCPRLNAVLHETVVGSSTTGYSVIDEVITSDTFGQPKPGSVIIDSGPTGYVVADVLGNLRDATPDRGAFEYNDGSVATDCMTSESYFQGAEIAKQEEDFIVKADITAKNNNMDAVTGFGAIAGSNYDDYAILVRLNTQGTIDARNGDVYASDVTVNYTAGVVYSFEIHVDMTSKTYDVYVTPASTGVKKMIANDYSFRTAQADISEFNYYCLISSSGTHDVCNVEITAAEESVCATGETSFQNFAIETQLNDFTIKADVTASNSNMDAVTGFGAIAGTSYSDYAILIRLNTQGTIDARNGADYASDAVVNYTPGVPYAFQIDVNMTAKTYDVYVTSSSTGVKTKIADDYSFRAEQANIDEFNYYSLASDFGTHDVCDVEVSAN